ncbi:hypothetical protein [Sphingorhabdus sp. M41]
MTKWIKNLIDIVQTKGFGAHQIATPFFKLLFSNKHAMGWLGLRM